MCNIFFLYIIVPLYSRVHSSGVSQITNLLMSLLRYTSGAILVPVLPHPRDPFKCGTKLLLSPQQQLLHTIQWLMGTEIKI